MWRWPGKIRRWDLKSDSATDLLSAEVIGLVVTAGGRAIASIDGKVPHDIVDVYAILLQAKAGDELKVAYADGKTETVKLLCRIDTLDELEYFRHGGILQYVLRHMMKAG